jgi:hypothetical protein
LEQVAAERLPVRARFLKGLVLVVVESKGILASQREDFFVHLEVDSGRLHFICLVAVHGGVMTEVFGVIQQIFADVNDYVDGRVRSSD